MQSTLNQAPNVGVETNTQNPGDAQIPLDGKPDPIQLPEGLVKAGGESYIVGQYAKVRKQFVDWFKDEYNRIEDNYRLFENKAAAGIKAQGPIIPLVYSNTQTKVARAMRDLMAQSKYFELMAEGKLALDWQARYERSKVIATQAAEMAAQMVDAGMPMPPPPPELPDISEVTGAVEDLLNEFVSDTEDFYQKMAVLFQTLELEKSMCAHVKWNSYNYNEMTFQREKSAIGAARPIVGQGYKTKEKGCPTFEPVSLREMAWDPRAKYNFQNASWVSRRFMVRPQDLKDWEAQGLIKNGNLASQLSVQDTEATQAGPMGGSQNSDKDPVAKHSKRVEGTNLPTGSADDKLIAVDMVWGLVTWMEGTEFKTQDSRYWIADEKTLLSFEENISPPVIDKMGNETPGIPLDKMKRPFAFGTVDQKIDQLMGFGAIDAIKALQVKIGNVQAAIDKLMWMAANSPIFYEPTSMMDAKRVSLDGQNLVAVMSSKNINRMPPPTEAINVLQNYIQFLISELRQATASNDTAQGIDQGSDGTATEAAILDKSSDIRMQYGKNMINASFFLQLGQLYRELVLQAGTDGEMVTRESGVDGVPKNVPMEWIGLRYIFRPSAAIPESRKLTQFRILDEFVQKLIAIPPQLLTDEAGNQMMPALYNFIVQDMMPLVIGSGGKRLFRKMPPTMPGPSAPGLPAGPTGEGEAMPDGGAPMPNTDMPPIEAGA